PLFFFTVRPPPCSTPFPYTTLFRSLPAQERRQLLFLVDQPQAFFELVQLLSQLYYPLPRRTCFNQVAQAGLQMQLLLAKSFQLIFERLLALRFCGLLPGSMQTFQGLCCIGKVFFYLRNFGEAFRFLVLALCLA